MISNHLKRALTQKIALTKSFYNNNNTFINHNFSTTPQKQPINYIDQYRNLLLKFNVTTLRNEFVQMKKITKMAALKIKKMEIINQLCELQQQKIKNRLLQLNNKTLYQLESVNIFQQQIGLVGQKELQEAKQKNAQNPQSSPQTLLQQQEKQHKQQQIPFYEKFKTSNSILKESLKKHLTTDTYKTLFTQKISHTNIMDALYQNWVKKNKQLKEKLQLNQQNQRIQREAHKDQGEQQIAQKKFNQQSQLTPQQQKLLKNLRKKPFINRLFKTNEQLIVEQKRRKYLYEYEKSDILNQITDNSPSNFKNYKKSMLQISQERKQNMLSKGFFMRYSSTAYKQYFKKTQKMLYLYCGFFYYRQLITTPYLIQFIFALTFDRKLPLEFTILKIVQEYLQCPKTFKYNLMAISKEHYLKFLRASSNYILKMFKKVDTVGQNSNNDLEKSQSQNGLQKEWDESQDISDLSDDYSDDDLYAEDKQKLRKKLAEQSQKFPKSKQFIDLQLIRFALAIFQVGVERIVGQLNQNKQFFLNRGQFEKLQLSKNQQKQLKSLHETLMLSFDVYKTIQSLFVSIEINDFNDLDKLSHVLISYHKIRKYLSQKISVVHKFMLNFDKQYEQKLQLGLGNITTEKQLQIENYILRNQARKLNFDIIDNITSMLKHDNLQITLQNKRLNIFGVLERMFEVYIENDMIDFLQDQLIYTIVRFLEKQVYLDNKVRSLFDARVNFDGMLVEKDRKIMAMNSDGNGNDQNQSEDINANNNNNNKDQQKQSNNKKQSTMMMQTFGLNASDQYDFSRTQFTSQQQNPFVTNNTSSTSSLSKSSKPLSSTSSSSNLPNEFEWFQLQSVYPSSEQQPGKQYDFDSLVFEKTQKSQYFMGKISELLPKQLLFSLIRIIKHKHDRKEILIQQMHGFNLIQQWYSQPSVVRLQFLKEEIIQRYKRMAHYQNVVRSKSFKSDNNVDYL